MKKTILSIIIILSTFCTLIACDKTPSQQPNDSTGTNTDTTLETDAVASFTWNEEVFGFYGLANIHIPDTVEVISFNALSSCFEAECKTDKETANIIVQDIFKNVAKISDITSAVDENTKINKIEETDTDSSPNSFNYLFKYKVDSQNYIVTLMGYPNIDNEKQEYMYLAIIIDQVI